MTTPIRVDRAQVLAYRRSVGALDERLAAGHRSLRVAAWAGLQDSMPRAAVLSLHARVRDVGPTAWEEPSLEQVWGPRYSAYVVAGRDRAVFTLGRLPDDARGRERARTLAVRMRELLGDEARGYGEVGEALGVNPNALRYAAATGTVLIRWDGARQPLVRVAPAPDVTPEASRCELARRFLHVFGPASAADFAGWAGISTRAGAATFSALHSALSPVSTEIGDGVILAADEPLLRAPPEPIAGARLLPSGDALFLAQGAQRALLVADAARRAELWTPRVWPGALLLDGAVRGTWRRAAETVIVRPWGRLAAAGRAAVEAEVAGLPIPGVADGMRLRWE